MKKYFISLFIITAMTGLLLPPSQVQAADFSIGLYSFYTMWDPAWRSVYKECENDPMLLWGPYLSVTFFNKLSFTALALQNQTNISDASYSYEGNGTSGKYTAKVDTTISRNELDLTMGYKITSGINTFIGFKFMGYNTGQGGDNKTVLTSGTGYSFDDVSNRQSMGTTIGGAIGASYTLTLAESFYLTAGNSIVASNSAFQISTFYEKSPGILSSQNNTVYSYKSVGDNTTLSFTYFLQEINTSFSLGGRFQVLKHFEEGNSPALDNDYFYGITLSAIYYI